MKKSFVFVSLNIASLGVFVMLTGLLISISVVSENKQTANTESFFWSFYTKPQDLIAQVKTGVVEPCIEQTSDNSANKTEVLNIPKPTNVKPDSTSVKEDGDTTKNAASDNELIHQVLQMNGCFDICNDFVEKDWMKDHSFIIL